MSSEKVDFTLLVPDYLLESDRFVEFLQVLEEFTTEVMQGVDEIQFLQVLTRLLEEREWVEEYVREVGAGFGFNREEMGAVAGNLVECVRRVGVYEAFRYLVVQIYKGGIVIEDNFEKVLRLSENGVLSGAYLQDGMLYRDGSINCSLPYFLLQDRYLRIIKQFFPVGVFVWFYAFMFVFLFEDRNKIESVTIGQRSEIEFEDVGGLDIYVEGQVGLWGYGKDYLNEDWKWYRMVINEDAVILG